MVIDEIQKVPALLDEVHRLIEERGWRFLLTASSARKLNAHGVNLLAGRAWLANVFPLSAHELGEYFDLIRMLRFGEIPSVYLSQDPEEELQAYVATYINEEIKQEGLVRKLPSFLSFLRLAQPSPHPRGRRGVECLGWFGWYVPRALRFNQMLLRPTLGSRSVTSQGVEHGLVEQSHPNLPNPGRHPIRNYHEVNFLEVVHLQSGPHGGSRRFSVQHWQ